MTLRDTAQRHTLTLEITTEEKHTACIFRKMKRRIKLKKLTKKDIISRYFWLRLWVESLGINCMVGSCFPAHLEPWFLCLTNGEKLPVQLVQQEHFTHVGTNHKRLFTLHVFVFSSEMRKWKITKMQHWCCFDSSCPFLACIVTLVNCSWQQQQSHTALCSAVEIWKEEVSRK